LMFKLSFQNQLINITNTYQRVSVTWLPHILLSVLHLISFSLYLDRFDCNLCLSLSTNKLCTHRSYRNYTFDRRL
jgi:hypothetical protein